MNNFFYKLYKYFKNRKLALLGFLVLLVACLLFFSLRLNLEEDISKVIPQSEKTKTLNKVLKNTDFSDKIIVNISVKTNGTAEDLILYASEILDSLQRCCQGYILNIQGQIEDDAMEKTMEFISANLPLFLEENDYKYIRDNLRREKLNEVVLSNYKTIIAPSGLIAKKLIRKDPLGLTFRALKKLEALKISDDFELYNGFLLTKNKKNLLLFVKPSLPTNETDANTDFVNKLYAISDGLNLKYAKTVKSEYYGSTVIAVSNANQIKTDIKYTVSLALTILLIILILFYKRFTIPILLFIPTGIGALIAIVSLYFIRDTISAISLGIGSVLLGITLDYSLHILTHFRKNNDVKQLYSDVTKPILMSSITTAIAFLCLLFLKSQALQDLGIFAAISVVSASLFALLIVPLLYKPKQSEDQFSKNIIEKFASYNFDKNKFLVAVCILAVILSFFTYNQVRFNQDLNSMNYQSEATLTAERHLDTILNLSSKSVYIVAYGNEIDEVLDANTEINNGLLKAKSLGEIDQYSSNGNIVLSAKEQNRKIEQWNSFWTDATIIDLKKNLKELGNHVGFKESTYQPFYEILDTEFPLLNLMDYAEVKPLLTQEFISDKSELKTAVSLVKLDSYQKAKLEEIIQNIPNAILIDRKEISETFLGGLKENFSTLINYSFLAIVIILLIFFRNIELTLLTTIPIVLTWILTLGVMGLFGIEFTIFNVIITTFIFGLGVDYSIFMTNALVKDYTYGTKEISTYKVSILLSVITTILGVGALIFAKHPALRSISILSLVGILITVFVTFTIQPFIFRVFVKNRAKNDFQPIKIGLFIHSFFLLILYGLGGIILSIFSITILQILPISKKIKFKWMHKSLAKLVILVLYANPFVRKKVINEVKESFEKPAIIISNHASSLDTLTLGLLTSNVIYLVNDWVFRSPVFGILARVLGFYPVSSGIEGSTEHLQEKINQGYLLVVFPEAKRSLTNKIGRFHKGAFFLQHQLKLDILPVYLHGNSEVMPKNDFIIYNGSLTVKVGERIRYDDMSYGITDRERNKNISKLYKNNFLKFRNEIESEDYFKNILFSNYYYKEPKILKSVHADFKVKKQLYHTLNMELPMKSKILHIGDDYGQIDILLVSKSIERKIHSFIDDDSKRMIANNCYISKHRKVKYITKINDPNIVDFDILLLTKNKSMNLIKDSILSDFKQIIVANDSYPKKEITKIGFIVQKQFENLVVYSK